MNRRQWSLVFLVALVGTAACTCGGNGAPPGAKYKFTADGTGPEGKKLSPRVIGQLHSAFGFVKDGVIQGPAGASIRDHEFFNETYSAAVQTDVGLFITASTEDGVLANPTLLVPATVRVGMKWEVFADQSDPAYRYEVTSRQEGVATAFGPATTWTIVQTRADGTMFARNYAEGFGSIDIAPDIWPVDDQQIETPALHPLPLVPVAVPVGFTFVKDAPWIDGVSMLRLDHGPGLLLVAGANYVSQQNVVQPSGSGCLLTDGLTLEPRPNDDGHPFRRTNGLVCPRARYCVLSPVPGDGDRCQNNVLHANGAWVDPQGTVTWVPRKWTGEVSEAGRSEFGPRGADTVTFGNGVTAIAPLVGADGGADALYHSRIGPFAAYGVGLPEHYGDPPFTGSGPPQIQTNWVAPVDSEVVNLGPDELGRTRFLMRMNEMIYWSRLEGNRLSFPRLGGRLSGRLSAQAKPGGADVLRITSEGSVDRFVLVGDELKLTHLADVQVPKLEVGIGAFAWDDHLLVATIGAGTGTNVFDLKVYRTTGSLGEGQTVQIPQALTLTIETLGSADAQVVCWRPNGAPLDLSQWKLGDGAADLTVEQGSHGDTCVVISLDSRSLLTSPQQPRGRVDALIPGVGRVILTPTNNTLALTSRAFAPQGPVAALADGTFVTPTQSFGRGGLALGLADVVGMNPASSEFAGMADLGGAGLWVTENRLAGSKSFLLKAQTTKALTLALLDGGVAAQVQLANPAWPTGVIVTAEGGRYLVKPSGASAYLQAETSASTTCATLADGTHCGTLDDGYYCQPPSGPLRQVTQPTVNPTTCRSWIPAGDGTFFVGAEIGSWSPAVVGHLDPASMTLTSVPASLGTVVGAGVDQHGHGLVVNYGVGGALQLLRATATGFVELPVPPYVWTSGGSNVNRATFTASQDVLFMNLGWTSALGPGGPMSAFRMAPAP